jgi:CBS domain containing-hemolysin-like protein
MPVPYLGLRLLLLAFIVAVNAFFAGAEVALLSVRESKLRQMAEQGQTGARIALELLANPSRLLGVTQVGVTLASLGLGWAGEDTLYELVLYLIHPLAALPSALVRGFCFGGAFLVMTYIHVIAGEVVPKNLAINTSDRLAVVVAPGLMLFTRIAGPFLTIIERSVSIISRAMGLGAKRHAGGHSADEIRLIVASSRGAGTLPEAQEEMINRVLDLEDVLAREVMVGRNEIVSVSIDASLDEVLQTMIAEEHSRLPVWEDSPEQIVGMVFYKDLLPVWQERRRFIREGRPQRPFRVRQIMRKPIVVPETKPLSPILEEFRTGKSHLAIVVDEFGTVTGLITLEDVLEQIVGEIEDEFDETRQLHMEESTELELDGATKIIDLESLYGVTLPSDAGFETLAGYLLHRLGHIPKPGETVDFADRRFTVVTMERNRIARVQMTRIEAEKVTENAGI